MDRMKWFGLFWCTLLYLVYPSESTGDKLSLCKKSPSASHVEELDCRNLNYKFIPPEIRDINIKRIYLSKNPLVCYCGILWFLTALQGKSLNVKIEDLDHVTCAKPAHLKGKLVKDLKKKDVCGEVLPCQRSNCSINAKCVVGDSTGQHKCVCRTGYLGNGTVCRDLDECSLGTHSCDVSQECHNTIGAFECRCKAGLKTNNGHCDVPDPCEILFNPCHLNNEVCLDKQRGYECVCKSGFKKKSRSNICTDVNECERQNSCSKRARCINKIGSYHCVCKEGYSGNGKNCEDIDECESGEHECPSEAVCVNSVGGYQCICKPGYDNAKDGTAQCVKKEEEKSPLKIKIILSVVGAVVFIFSFCCCCCCTRRKSKKQKKRAKEKLIGDKAAKANQDLMNLAMETDPFLLQQQQVEQQMFMFGMQQQPPPFMPFFDNEAATMPRKGVRPNEYSMTTWSDDDIYAESSEYYN